MSTFDSDYVCAISGRSPKDTDLILDADDSDDLDTLPIGWVRVTVERRGVNTAWLALQGVKARALANMVGQVPDEISEEEKAMFRGDMVVMVDAQFFAIEAATPRYSTESVVLVVRNPDEDAGVAAEWGKVAAALGFPPAVVEDGEA